MNSVIYQATAWHMRQTPARHSFQYKIDVFALDLNEIQSMNRFFPLIAWNRRAVLSVREQNHLRRFSGPLKEKLQKLIGPDVQLGRAVMITLPVFLGYIFNPVSFFICYDQRGLIKALAAEVNNTFGETHVYRLIQPEPATAQAAGPFEFEKKFYVSPFYDVAGRYRLTLHKLGDALDMSVEHLDDKGLTFFARIKGSASQIRRRSLLAAALRYPLRAWLTMTFISWQALKLYFLRRLKIYDKPSPPSSPETLSSPRVIHKARWGLVKYAQKYRSGRLAVGFRSSKSGL